MLNEYAQAIYKNQYYGQIGTKRHQLFDYYRFKINQKFKKLCPDFHYLLFKARKKEMMAKRRLLSSIMGLMLGYLFSKLFVAKFGFEPRLERLLSLLVIIFSAIGYTLSVQVRTIFWLMIPTFLGSSGRSFIFALMFATLAAEPVSNIIANCREAALTLICTFNYHRQMLAEKMNLVFEPIKKIITNLGKANTIMKQNSKKVGAQIMPKITNEITNEENLEKNKEDIMKADKIINREKSRIDQIEKAFQQKTKMDSTKEKLVAKYLKKNDYQCEAMFSKAIENCSHFFHLAHGKCYEKISIPLIGPLICVVLSAVRICSLLANFGKERVCDAKKNSPSGIGEAYHEINSSLEDFERSFEAQVKFKYFQGEPLTNLTSVSQIGQLVEATVEESKNYFKFGMFIFSKFVSFIFLVVFFKAIKYHNLYLSKIYFDNTYITSYFRHIDCRRLTAGKIHLLPLRRIEKLELIDVLNFKINQKEKKQFKSSAFLLSIISIGVIFLLCFDYFFAQVLSFVQTNSEVTKETKGKAEFKLFIEGQGLIANLLRKVLSEFEISSKLNKNYTNVKCLPNPKQTHISTYYFILFYFLIIIIINFFQAYASRLRRIICAFFYPKREKKRILFLYNDRLKKRKNFQAYKIHFLRKMVNQKVWLKEQNIFYYIYFYLFRKFFKSVNCVVCEEKLDRNIKTCESCKLTYCNQCWKDTEKTCRACDKVQSDDTDLTDDEL